MTAFDEEDFFVEETLPDEDFPEDFLEELTRDFALPDLFVTDERGFIASRVLERIAPLYTDDVLLLPLLLFPLSDFVLPEGASL